MVMRDCPLKSCQYVLNVILWYCSRDKSLARSALVCCRICTLEIYLKRSYCLRGQRRLQNSSSVPEQRQVEGKMGVENVTGCQSLNFCSCYKVYGGIHGEGGFNGIGHRRTWSEHPASSQN